jgi:hypothetical protein
MAVITATSAAALLATAIQLLKPFRFCACGFQLKDKLTLAVISKTGVRHGTLRF